LPPRALARPLHRLPPILDNVSQTPTSSCSKGARGLSVQPRVLGIFTETTVSPDPSLRQRPSRYAIRAGRNLPDKEFRSSCYLKTCPGKDRRVGANLPPHVAMGNGPYLHLIRGGRRVVSEDSANRAGFTSVHRLRDPRNLQETVGREMATLLHQLENLDEFHKFSRFDVKSG
jgi:hypothetical protein